MRFRNHFGPGCTSDYASAFPLAPALFFTLLAELVLQFWEDGRFPRAWITSVQVPLPKKAWPVGVEDYRTLTLGCVLSKLLARHLYVLLRAILPPLPWYQAGFEPGRSTYDHILLLRKVLDERWQAGDPVYVLALDIKAAFPSVLWRELAEVLLADGVPPFLLNRLVALALSDATSIRWQAGRTREVLTRRGVKQGCPLAPYLFTLALHAVLQCVVAALPRFRLDLDGADFNPLVCTYADDLLVASTRFEDVSRFLDEFAPRALELGLALDFRKCMERPPGAVDPRPLPRPVQVAGREVQQVAKIVYLGALLTAGLERRGVAYHRVVKAQRAVATLQPLLHCNPLPPMVVSRIYRTTVLASLSYEQSSTATTKATRMTLRRQAGVLTGALMASARRPQRGLVRLVGEERRKASITRAIRGARVRYWGHILRCPPAHPPPRCVLQFEVGRKKVGRPCHTFNTALAADLARLPAPAGG
ncbi:Retrovirus-related Pol polyprotein from type-1 retrotransposable element R2 [Frankliniella fusca]|uniref:Retrovirus-related Pol polyprotein from type-1 retrotransposable element R2 n=1 Tax=Frankliniella fusca TaxID=407009 RepID=A0AAE1HPT1_9NEOP|nr:Retrovirus-related Pol polyprotein from type-1 retrotransposable element R2 [Frankliniella fusca]